MALITADLTRRPCHSQIHEAVLEDAVENIGTLIDQDVDTRDDGSHFVNALYKVDASSLVGTILRRPFQGLSHLTLEHDDMYAACLIWKDKSRRQTLEKIRKTQDSIAFETFKNRSIYLLDLDCLEIRIAQLVPTHVDPMQMKSQVPKHIGKAKGFRWTVDDFLDDGSSILAEGTLSDQRKFVILMHIQDSRASAQVVLSREENEVDSDASSVQSSQSSASGPSDVFVKTILHGEHNGLADIRLALVYPECIEKVCK